MHLVELYAASVKNIRSKQVANGYKIPINCLKLAVGRSRESCLLSDTVQRSSPICDGINRTWQAGRGWLRFTMVITLLHAPGGRHAFRWATCFVCLITLWILLRYCEIQHWTWANLGPNTKVYLYSDVNAHFTWINFFANRKFLHESNI